jgi:iron complex transport system permease protein
VVGIVVGDVTIDPWTALRAALGEGTETAVFIVQEIRVVRLVGAMFVGAALGVAGAIFQTVVRNPLGSPDILGFTTGAATGALVALLFLGASFATAGVGALIGGLATGAAVFVLAAIKGGSMERMVVIGIGMTATLGAANAWLLTRARLSDARQASMWLVGSLDTLQWNMALTVAISTTFLIMPAILLMRAVRPLAAGDEVGTALGVRISVTRPMVMFVGILIAGFAVAAAGPVALVAFAAPQIAVRLTRSSRIGVISSALTGALMLMICDITARSVLPHQVPVGILTVAIGGTYLVWLITRDRAGNTS